MLKQKVHSGLALTLVWAVGLAFATAIILKVGESANAAAFLTIL